MKSNEQPLLRFLQQFRSQDQLLSYLSAKLSYEAAIRSYRFSVLAFYVGLTITFVSGASITFHAAWPWRHSAIGLILIAGSLVVGLLSLVAAWKIIRITGPRYHVIPLGPLELQKWWNQHLDSIAHDPSALAKVANDEKARMLLSLSDSVETLDAANRAHAVAALSLRRWIVLLVLCGLIVVGAGVALRVASGDQGMAEQAQTQSENDKPAGSDPRKDEVNQIDPGPSRIEKTSGNGQPILPKAKS